MMWWYPASFPNSIDVTVCMYPVDLSTQARFVGRVGGCNERCGPCRDMPRASSLL